MCPVVLSPTLLLVIVKKLSPIGRRKRRRQKGFNQVIHDSWVDHVSEHDSCLEYFPTVLSGQTGIKRRSFSDPHLRLLWVRPFPGFSWFLFRWSLVSSLATPNNQIVLRKFFCPLKPVRDFLFCSGSRVEALPCLVTLSHFS